MRHASDDYAVSHVDGGVPAALQRLSSARPTGTMRSLRVIFVASCHCA